jgi:Tol biopolymer transport system component
VRDLTAGTTRLLSARPDGAAGGPCDGTVPVLSADGRVVVFASFDGGIAASDKNSAIDVFAHDTTTGATTLVSLANAAVGSFTGNGHSSTTPSSISADGRYIVFTSLASDLVGNDANGLQDVFLRDTVSGTTTLVSLNAAGTGAANGQSRDPVLSANGRYVAFVSGAPDLVANDVNGFDDVFVRDLQGNMTLLVSMNPAGQTSAASSSSPSISADGRFVAFQSSASDLVAGVGDNGGRMDVFVRDLVAGSTVLVSIAAGANRPGAADSILPVISSDGRYVAFQSAAGDLVLPVQLSQGSRVFLRDLQQGVTIRVSAEGTSFPLRPALSADGQWLLYQAPQALGARASVPWLFNVSAGTSLLVCTNCHSPSVSGDGRFVAFVRSARVPQSLFETVEVFDRERGVSVAVSVTPDGNSTGNSRSVSPVISADGRFVVFESRASDLSPDDANGLTDVFARDLESGIPFLLSRSRTSGAPGNSLSVDALIGPDSRTVVFQSFSSDLATGDRNEASDVFLLRLKAGDADADRLPDNWERFYFGGLDENPDADSDADGQSNRAEFAAGSNPASAAFTLRVGLMSTLDGRKLVTWSPLLGRHFQVEYKDRLAEPQWLPLLGNPGTTSAGVSGIYDATAASASERFYRVVVLP